MNRPAECLLLLARQPMLGHVCMGSQTEADERRLSDGNFGAAHVNARQRVVEEGRAAAK